MSARRLPESEQIALAVAEECPALALSLAWIVVGDDHDVVVNIEASDVEGLEL